VRIAVVGNGQSVHVVGRSAAMAARGHDVRLVTLGPVLPTEGIEVRSRPLPRHALAGVAALRSFLEDIRSFRPDLLHLHYAGGRLGTLATLAGIRPFVVSVMGGDVLPEQHADGLSRRERRATRRILEEADLLLAKSDALRPAIAAFGDITASVETVRWGVDPRRFHRDPAAAEALRARLGLAEHDRVVLSSRLLRPLYNIHLVVEALPRLLETVPDALLLVTEYNPDPAYRKLLDERVQALGLQRRVVFVGRREHEEMPAFYSLAEAVVSIPSSDGLPQTLFEAMACETPVVLGRVPGYAEVVADGESALLVDFQAEAVAAALRRLMQEPALARALAGRALEEVREKASLPRAAARVEELYRRVLSLPTRRERPRRRVRDALSLLLR
jgi:glycosyltransferase involved in cell wall biosynthesis